MTRVHIGTFSLVGIGIVWVTATPTGVLAAVPIAVPNNNFGLSSAGMISAYNGPATITSPQTYSISGWNIALTPPTSAMGNNALGQWKNYAPQATIRNGTWPIASGASSGNAPSQNYLAFYGGEAFTDYTWNSGWSAGYVPGASWALTSAASQGTSVAGATYTASIDYGEIAWSSDATHFTTGTLHILADGIVVGTASLTPSAKDTWGTITASWLAPTSGQAITLQATVPLWEGNGMWNGSNAVFDNATLTKSSTQTWSGSGTTWNTATSPSWVENDNRFYTGDTVLFDNTAARGNTTVTVAGNVQPGAITVNNTKTGASTYTLGGSGTISGATSLTKTGDGTLVITNANTYTGLTTVAGGTLLVRNTTGSATGTGDVVVQQGATLGGSGIVTGKVDVSGTISPSAGGSTPALLTTGSETWNATGVYSVLVTDGTGLPGTGWDELVIEGALQQSAGFTIQPVADGLPANVRLCTVYDWVIAKVTSGEFDTSGLTLDISHFNTGYTNRFSFKTQDLSGGGQELILQYSAVPETTTLLLGTIALAPVLMQRRARRVVED